jgi:hypothetical protein
VPNDANWPIARAYLVETRGIDPTIVDDLHAVGTILANDHRPNPRPIRHRRRRNPAQLSRIIGFCPPILSVLALPQAPASGEKKGRRHLLRPLNRSPRKPAPGLLE